jgi:NRAMP (natural resistance-associated macrophage protein)-like metal ion transporter
VPDVVIEGVGQPLSPAKQRSLDRTHSAGSGMPVLAPFGLDPPSSFPPSPAHGSREPPAGFRQDVVASLLGDQPLQEEPWTDPSTVSVPFWKRLLAFTGPGWLMSIAYVDPGNLEADLQCGAQFGYTLLWVLLSATCIGLGMQLVAARLGCATRRHLAEHCRENYGTGVRIMLWLLTELAIIGSDIQEVIGCSIGLQLLFGLPLEAGVLVTAAAAFGFLFLERFGTRPLELFFGLLILILALSMGGLFAEINPDRAAVLEGFVVPRLPASAMSQAVGMVGCIIMPHNLFLHSALVQSRVVEKGEEREAITLYTIESTAAILTSVLINSAVVSIFAKGFHGGPHADEIGLKNAGSYLGRQYGEVMRIIWGLGLVAAGQSSTMTGAYAGQWVMQGYLQLQVKPWKRAIITRSMALVPTLAVAVYFGGGHNEGLDSLNSYLNILQSLVLPFAVVPLLTFASARSIMGDLALSFSSTAACWAATALVMAANVYLFVEQVGGEVSQGLVLGITAYTASVGYVAIAHQIPSQASKK